MSNIDFNKFLFTLNDNWEGTQYCDRVGYSALDNNIDASTGFRKWLEDNDKKFRDGLCPIGVEIRKIDDMAECELECIFFYAECNCIEDLKNNSVIDAEKGEPFNTTFSEFFKYFRRMSMIAFNNNLAGKTINGI